MGPTYSRTIPNLIDSLLGHVYDERGLEKTFHKPKEAALFGNWGEDVNVLF